MRAGSSGFQAGMTHTQRSADSSGNPEAIRRAEQILGRIGPLQNQHLMGWGALNPEPRPGEYDWGSLDSRVELMRRTHATIVITLCGAPDWMKGGKPGETDWTKLEKAPLTEHFDDFAALAVQVAKRYPDVKHYQVWNEFKGFWLVPKNRWNHESYTEMYNKVYIALKTHDRNLQVGGPYVPVDSWKSPPHRGTKEELRGPWGVADHRALDAIEYWLQHKRGADFVTIDGGMQTKDGFSPAASDGVRKFAAITQWLRQRTDLPIWWAEFYIGVKAGSDASTPETLRSALVSMRDAGASAALLWGGEDSGNFPALWTSTQNADGGQATGYLPAMIEFSARSKTKSLDPAPQR